MRFRVRAASIHAGDWYAMTGLPYLLRVEFGFSAPRRKAPGNDIAGEVEAPSVRLRRL